MTTNNLSNVGVNAGTRNHKGAFVPHAVYKLIEVDQTGWALICQDQATCHYVDPDALREVRHAKEQP